jgi:chaperonin GroEL (HSP60 family)
MSLGTVLSILSRDLFKKSEDSLEVNLNSSGLIRIYQLSMESSTRIIDYHLKGCIEGEFSKIAITGKICLAVTVLSLSYCGPLIGQHVLSYSAA